MQPMVMVKTRAMKAMAGAVPMPEVQAMDLVDGEGEMDGIPLGTQNIRIMQPKGTEKATGTMWTQKAARRMKAAMWKVFWKVNILCARTPCRSPSRLRRF